MGAPSFGGGANWGICEIMQFFCCYYTDRQQLTFTCNTKVRLQYKYLPSQGISLSAPPKKMSDSIFIILNEYEESDKWGLNFCNEKGYIPQENTILLCISRIEYPEATVYTGRIQLVPHIHYYLTAAIPVIFLTLNHKLRFYLNILCPIAFDGSVTFASPIHNLKTISNAHMLVNDLKLYPQFL